jgi:hypothetical protein
MAMSDTGVRIPVLPHGPITDGTNQFWANGRPFSIQTIPAITLGERAYSIGYGVAEATYGRTDKPFLNDMIKKYYGSGNAVLISNRGEVVASSVYRIHAEQGMMELSYGFVEEPYRNGDYKFGDIMLGKNIELAENLGLGFLFAKSNCAPGLKSLLRSGFRTPLLGSDIGNIRKALVDIGYYTDEELRWSMSENSFYDKYSPLRIESDEEEVKKIMSQLSEKEMAFLARPIHQQMMSEHNPDMSLPIQDSLQLEPSPDLSFAQYDLISSQHAEGL